MSIVAAPETFDVNACAGERRAEIRSAEDCTLRQLCWRTAPRGEPRGTEMSKFVDHAQEVPKNQELDERDHLNLFAHPEWLWPVDLAGKTKD